MKPATSIAVAVFALVAIAHLLRLVLQIEVRVGSAAVPMWSSVAGLVVAVALAAGLWREARSSS